MFVAVPVSSRFCLGVSWQRYSQRFPTPVDSAEGLAATMYMAVPVNSPFCWVFGGIGVRIIKFPSSHAFGSAGVVSISLQEWTCSSLLLSTACVTVFCFVSFFV